MTQIKTKSAILYADSARGVYIPQYFAESVNRDCLKYAESADLDILASGPDTEGYFDAWTSVLDNAELTDPESGLCGVLVQGESGDLFVVFAESAIAACNAYVTAQLEYEESHKDAGDNYSHSPAESWSRQSESNMAKQFGAVEHYETTSKAGGWYQWVEKYPAIDCKGLPLDIVARLALDNLEMMAGNIHTASCPDSVIVLDSYPVGEIEITELQESVGLDELTFDYIKDSLDCYVNSSGYAYVTTDSVWYAVIDRAKLQGLIDQEVESI